MTDKRISAELIAIISVGVALLVGLGGLMLTLQARTDQQLDALSGRMDALEVRMGSLEQRVARIEGLIEGSALFATGKHSRPDGR